MRHSEQNIEKQPYKIIAVDDESGIIDSLSVFLKRSGYQLTRYYKSFRSNWTCSKRTFWFNASRLYYDTYPRR